MERPNRNIHYESEPEGIIAEIDDNLDSGQGDYASTTYFLLRALRAAFFLIGSDIGDSFKHTFAFDLLLVFTHFDWFSLLF